MHLLFRLSLLPLTTAWRDESGFVWLPVSVYGANLMLQAIAYFHLQGVISRSQGSGSVLARAIGRDLKGKTSPVPYLIGIALAPAGGVRAHALNFDGFAVFAGVAVLWLMPDRRIERDITAGAAQPGP